MHLTDAMNSMSTRTSHSVPAAPPRALAGLAVLAVLAPLAVAALWSVHRALLDPDDGGADAWHRLLRNGTDNCAVANGTAYAAAPVSGGGDLLNDIRSTTCIASIVGFLCLVLYELFRRDPIVGKYVYDRKRLTQPDRTPPPLMLSRGLWRGSSGDAGAPASPTCCRTLPALGELVFLNLDAKYVRYSRAADDARRAREARGLYACGRAGGYHANCCHRNNRGLARLGEDAAFRVDDDGYTFYGGYSAEYDAVYRGDAAATPDGGEGLPPPSPPWTKGIHDLFPEDNLRPGTTIIRPGDPWRILFNNTQSLYREPEGPGSNEADTAAALPACIEEDEESPISKDAPASVPMQSSESGSHGETATARDAAPDEADPSLPLLPARAVPKARCDSGSDADTIAAENTTLPYPRRLQNLFLPPGFHTWGSVLEFLRYFFCVPALEELLCRRGPRAAGAGGRRAHGRGPGGARPGRDLTDGERELLRCAGLDTYLLIRFARFGFDVTFYPFLVACAFVLPIYQACKKQKDPDAAPVPGSFFGLTIDEVGQNDRWMIWIIVLNFLLYMFIMRRLWSEWELFIKLRHDFLSKGDKSFHHNPACRRVFSHTVMVESVPRTHRSDRNLREVFESLFPGQIEHAEMLINTSTLENLVDKRRAAMDKYNSVLARYRYECWNYATLRREGKLVNRCGNIMAEPVKPKVRIQALYFGWTEEDAFTYHKKKINDIDALIDKEYCEIVEHRLKWRDVSLTEEEEGDAEQADSSIVLAAQSIYSVLVPSTVRAFLGEQSKFCHGVGMVKFKSTAAKQGAVQCNLSGQPYWMITKDAPDPRDLNWSNVGVSRNTLETRKIIVQTFLLLGIIVWAFIITLANQFMNDTIEKIQAIGGFQAEVIQDYIPALTVSIILILIPHLLFFLARRVIHFKSHTLCDEFVLMWSTGYRLANIYFTIFGISAINSLQCFSESPVPFARSLATSGINQSAVLMKLVILAAGQETMLQLLQWRSLIKQALFRPLVNVNARSRRFLDSLNEAPYLEKSFIFGFYAPVLSYALMIAVLYAFMAPIMLAICAIFFWIATKVHTHNALFVFCQPFEGGGTIFYYFNRQVFFALYSSIVFFTIFLLLKNWYTTGGTFFVLMSLITYSVQKAVTNTFVVNSLHLPISLARVNDEEEIALLEGTFVPRDGREHFMYRHPVLNQDNWNSIPTWK